MTKEARTATACGLCIFLGSFLLPAARGSVAHLSGYEAAWNILTLPFRERPESLWRGLLLILIWPTNPVLLATFVRLLLGKVSWTRSLAAYGFVGQLYWLFDPQLQIREFGVGYWVWLFSGAALLVIAVMVRVRINDATPSAGG